MSERRYGDARKKWNWTYGIGACNRPVSYTHLDVYKRQMLNDLTQRSAQGNQQARDIEKRALTIQANADKAKSNTLGMYQDIQDRVQQAMEEARVVDQISGLAQNCLLYTSRCV